jgi:hypothetical protein
VVVQPKLSRKAKVAIAGAAAAVLAAAGIGWLLASPSINHSKQATARRSAAQQAAFIRSEIIRLKADQRLHRASASHPGESPTALVTDLQNEITADARSRVSAGTFKGPIKRTQCEAVTAGPLQPNALRGGYQCVAVNADIPPGVEVGGQLGYPFWAVVNYRRGTFAWCKINPKPGEMATQSREPVVDPPAACNLHI